MKPLSWLMLALAVCLGTVGFAQTPSQAQARCLKWITSERCTCAAERLSPKHLETYALWESAFVADEEDEAQTSVLGASGWDREESDAFDTGLERVQNECPGGLNYAVVIAVTSEAIQLNPQNVNALNRRGFAYTKQGDYALAIADYDAAIRFQPTNHSLWKSRCWARAIWGRELDLALADCNQSLRLRSYDSNTWDSRGLVHLRRSEFEEAVTDFDLATKYSGGDAKARSLSLYGRGLARLRMGKTVEGQADISAATAQDPKVAAEFASYGLAP